MMNRLQTLLLMCVFTLVTLFCAPLQAQENIMQQAMEGYKQLTTVKADVTKTVHDAQSGKDKVTQGTFYLKKPDKMCIVIGGSKDPLLKGDSFMKEVLTGIVEGNEEMDLSDMADVDMEREGELVILTVAPITKTVAERKKLKYQSYILTIDTRVGEIRTIRLMEQTKNYQEYQFSNYKRDVKIEEGVF